MDVAKIFEDLQRSSLILCKSYQDLWRSSRILKFLADLWGSTKIFDDPLQILPKSLRILPRSWGSSIFLPRYLRIFRILCWCQFKIPYKNNAYIHFIAAFYMLFYSYHFCIFSLFSRTILNQSFTYFKPIILKQKIAKK